jgi:signal transduction histidine kinase
MSSTVHHSDGVRTGPDRLLAENARLREERDRIARDLHDLAVQRLFAAGMTLQSALPSVDDPDTTERLRRAVDDLDATIKIIRSTISGLRAPDPAPPGAGLRARLGEAIRDLAAALGRSPALRLEGLLDTEVPRPVADEAVAVLREALTNVARHASAGTVEVTARVVSRRDARRVFALTVRDDGTGVPPGARRSGLHNLAERAERLGGELELSTPRDGGTLLAWRVPLG